MFANLQLNAEQQAAVNAIDGNFCVVAGPGAGKSTVLVERWKNMICRGIPMSDILNLTFTVSAAESMVAKAGIVDASKIFRTFHSYALDLLKRERQHLPFKLSEEVLPCGQDFLLMKELLKSYPAISSFRALKDKLSEWKRTNIEPEQALREAGTDGPTFFMACAYRDYERKCRQGGPEGQGGWLDFDSMIRESVKLLENNEEVRERNKKKYIAVDEFQDTDIVQNRLLELIYGGNIYAVGDENQLIYEFRSAQPGNLSNLYKTFSGTKTLFMGENFRSTKRIVAFLKKILPVDNGLASHMVSNREEGVDPLITKFGDEHEESSVVLSRITDPQNSAVIARTNRQLLHFQRACLSRGIRSAILGKKNLWQQTEVAHLLKLAKAAQSSRPAHEVLTELIAQNNLTYIYRNSGSPNEKDPVENLNEVVKLSAKRGTVKEFLDWLRRLTYASRKKVPDPVLNLATVHQAKGLEFKHVFVVGAQQGVIPHKDGELLEEHRILFVGASRAADTLEISFHGSHSQFLNDFVDQIEVYSGRT